jgi:hypothetical protein
VSVPSPFQTIAAEFPITNIRIEAFQQKVDPTVVIFGWLETADKIT